MDGPDDRLRAGCPRCPERLVADAGGAWSCPTHGATAALWRPRTVDYAAFTGHLDRAAGFPTYLPWPLGPGWSISDFAVVAATPPGAAESAGSRAAATGAGPDAATGGAALATMTCVSGTSALDGPVDVIVVSEETGTGLGARLAGLPAGSDGGPAPRPGATPAIADGPPEVKVRLEAHTVGLWPVSTSAAGREWDRSVLAGEAQGRWLWLVLRPASAILLLRDTWILRDVSATGPHLVTVPFGGPAPTW